MKDCSVCYNRKAKIDMPLYYDCKHLPMCMECTKETFKAWYEEARALNEFKCIECNQQLHQHDLQKILGADKVYKIERRMIDYMYQRDLFTCKCGNQGLLDEEIKRIGVINCHNCS